MSATSPTAQHTHVSSSPAPSAEGPSKTCRCALGTILMIAGLAALGVGLGSFSYFGQTASISLVVGGVVSVMAGIVPLACCYKADKAALPKPKSAPAPEDDQGSVGSNVEFKSCEDPQEAAARSGSPPRTPQAGQRDPDEDSDYDLGSPIGFALGALTESFADSLFGRSPTVGE